MAWQAVFPILLPLLLLVMVMVVTNATTHPHRVLLVRQHVATRLSIEVLPLNYRFVDRVSSLHWRRALALVMVPANQQARHLFVVVVVTASLLHPPSIRNS
ncbi:hypothetical protein BDF22DRAFT_684062 [Syncephalis plumigaleata]|nr:hypothetical protein BDF22DRAFT_684062 [Syncephalis plumigaleata]